MVGGGQLNLGTSAALGGGATPVFGTIGGASGPTTEDQSQWLRLKINGTDHWIPVWV